MQVLDQIVVRLAGRLPKRFSLATDRQRRHTGIGMHTATVFSLKLKASYRLGSSLAYLSSKDEEELLTTMRLDRAGASG